MQLNGAKVKGNPVKYGSGLRHCKQKNMPTKYAKKHENNIRVHPCKSVSKKNRVTDRHLSVGKARIIRLVCKPGNLPLSFLRKLREKALREKL